MRNFKVYLNNISSDGGMYRYNINVIANSEDSARSKALNIISQSLRSYIKKNWVVEKIENIGHSGLKPQLSLV